MAGELTAALELSKVVGRPLIFGTPSDPNDQPLVKTHSEQIDIKGFNLSVGKGVSFKKSGSSQWTVTELESGSLIATGTTKAGAEKGAREGSNRRMGTIDRTEGATRIRAVQPCVKSLFDGRARDFVWLQTGCQERER